MQRAALAELEVGDIVRVDGSWGVLWRKAVSRGSRYCVVDFWDGPARKLVNSTMVEVAKKRARIRGVK